MKVLITGASGMLAAEVIPSLLNLGHEVIKTDVKPRLEDIQALDITDRSRVIQLAKDTQPDYIFHLAAETNVDLCEQKPDHAYKVNANGTENIALVCQKLKCKLVYISTGGVFYGDKAKPYTEEDEPRPRNIYGESKLKGEKIVQDLLSDYYIFRAGWMVGGWDLDKKFVYKIVQQLHEGKTNLRVVSDKRGSPTFTQDFARNLTKVVDRAPYGLYHMTNKGTCSRHDIALKIVEFMQLSKEVTVEPISSNEFPLPAPRADSEMLDNSKLDGIRMNMMPRWEESLQYYIESNKVNL